MMLPPLVTAMGIRAGLVVAAIVIGASGLWWTVRAIQDNAVMRERARIETQQKEKVDAAKSNVDRLLGGDDSRVRGFDRD